MKHPQRSYAAGAIKWFAECMPYEVLNESETGQFFEHVQRALTILEQAETMIEKAELEQMR